MTDTAPRRAVLAGNNLAARMVCDLLLEALDPADVLCLAPFGGRHHAWQPSLAEHARDRGVRCLEPEDVNSPIAVGQVAEHRASLLLSVYYTQIFKGPLLQAVGGPRLNVHPSLLPRHRGVAPLVWAIVEGDTRTGVTIHHIDDGIDTGRVAWQRPLPIHPSDTGHELHMKAAHLVRAGCAEMIRHWLADGTVPEGREQSGRATTHTTRDPQVNHVDFGLGQRRVRDIVRALAPPLPGAFCHAPGGDKIVLGSVEPIAAPGDGLVKPPGYVEMALGGRTLVWTADGPLEIRAFDHDGTLRPGRELAELTGVREGDILG